MMIIMLTMVTMVMMVMMMMMLMTMIILITPQTYGHGGLDQNIIKQTRVIVFCSWGPLAPAQSRYKILNSYWVAVVGGGA